MDFRLMILTMCLNGGFLISALEPRCSEFNYLESLLEKLVRLENKIKQLEEVNIKENELLLSKVNDLDTRLTKRKDELKVLPVAFTAYLDDKLSLSVGDVLKFDKLLLNQGNHYSPSTGEFTVPYDGLFFFTWHIQTLEPLTTCLSLNGQCLLHAYARGLEAKSDILGDGNSATLHLAKGDKVMIVTEFGSSVYSNHAKEWYYPTFTGCSLR